MKVWLLPERRAATRERRTALALALALAFSCFPSPSLALAAPSPATPAPVNPTQATPGPDAPPPKSPPSEADLLTLDFKGVDIRDVLRALSLQQGVNILADESVSGPVTIHLTGVTFEEGLSLLLSSYGYTYTREGEKTYRVTRRPFTVEYRAAERTLTVRAQQAELDRLVREITLATGLNLLVEKGAEAKVSITIVNMPLETALRALAESQGLRLVQREGYYTFSAGGLVAPGGFLSVEVKDGLLTLEAREADLNAVLNEVAAKGKLNLIADREAKGPLTGSLRELPLLTGLRAFLEANGFQLVERYGTYLVRRAPPNNSLSITVKEEGKLDLAVFGTDLAAVLRELSERTGVNMVTYNYVRSQVNDVRLRDVTLEEALDFLLKGTNFTYRKEGETYLIGDGATLRADSLDLIETRLIPLRYLAAETLPTLLPQSFPANSVRS